MTSICVAIPTRNRPEALRGALLSVVGQVSQPEEMIVVDDSDAEVQESVRKVVEDVAPNASILRKDTPGLTRSRNLAADRAQADLICFIDDDVVLDVEYLQAIRAAFSDPTVAGAGGVVENEPGPRHPRLSRLAFLGGCRSGEVLRSGWPTSLPLADADAAFLSGCNMTFRTDLVRRERFNEEAFLEYGLAEDLEFSHRIRRGGRGLRILGSARLSHLSGGKVLDWRWGRQEVRVRPMIAGESFSMWRFTVAALTLCTVNVLHGRLGRARGNLAGWVAVWRDT